MPAQRKRQQHSSQLPSQLRLLAPKSEALPSHPETPVQYRLQSDIQNQQTTSTGGEDGNDINLQQSATPQSCVPLKSVSSSHGFTPSSTLQPNDFTFPTPEQTQHPVVALRTNIYSNRGPSTSVYAGFPELAAGDVASGVDDNVGPSTQHPLYCNLQLQETIQHQQGHDYWMPTPHAPEDVLWIAMGQPTVGVHQSQYFIRSI